MAVIWVTILSTLGASGTVFGAIYGAWSRPIEVDKTLRNVTNSNLNRKQNTENLRMREPVTRKIFSERHSPQAHVNRADTILIRPFAELPLGNPEIWPWHFLPPPHPGSEI